jgi:peptide deformylase
MARDRTRPARPQGAGLRRIRGDFRARGPWVAFDLSRRFAYLAAMALRDITLLPDPVLRQISTPIASVDAEVRALADDMLETMYKAPGIGLAAVQIGVPKRMLVVDVAKRGDKDAAANPMIFINPEITWTSPAVASHEEGCLSIPDYYEEVTRPENIRLKYMDEHGLARDLEADGILAICLQHEIDHLNGVLFIDYLSKLKRDRVIKKFAKQARIREG